MILASHQPNFLPYMNFFYKMYKADVFTVSNTVQYSKSDGMHNYNMFNVGCKATKLIVPVSDHNGPINKVRIAENFKPIKLLKTIAQDYKKRPFFDVIYPQLESIIMSKHELLWQLNYELLVWIHNGFGFKSKLVLENEIENLPMTPNEAIVFMAKTFDCSTYLSGQGAKKYLNEKMFSYNDIVIKYVDIPRVEYKAHCYLPNLSVLDYVMNNGFVIPKEWTNED